MKKVYIVFDQLQSATSGGLVAMYKRLVDILEDDFEIEIISVFKYQKGANEQFKNIKIHNISKFNIDICFNRIIKYLKNKQIKKFLYAVVSIIYYFIFIPIARLRIGKIIEKKSYVIVSCPSAAIFMSKKIKFILEIHSKFEFFWGNNIIGNLQIKLMRKPILTLFRTKSDANKAKKICSADYVYNFFDGCKIRPLFNVKKNKIIYIGRLHESKDPFRMLNIAKKLKTIRNDFKIDIYGTGPLEKDIREKIKEYNLDKNVKLLGFTEKKDVYSDYAMLLVTSKEEGFGLTIIEANANGIPAISTNWGDGVFEVIDNNNSGFILDNDKEIIEKINLLLDDNELLHKISKNAYLNYNQKFTPEIALKRWNEILTKLD